MRARRLTPPITPPTIAPRLVLFRERDEEPLTGKGAEVEVAAAEEVSTADAEGVLPANGEKVLVANAEEAFTADAEGSIGGNGVVVEALLPVLSMVGVEVVDGEVVSSAEEVLELEEDSAVVELTDEVSTVEEEAGGGMDESAVAEEVSEGTVESEIEEVVVVVVCELPDFCGL